MISAGAGRSIGDGQRRYSNLDRLGCAQDREARYSPCVPELTAVTPEVVDQAVFLEEIGIAPDGGSAFVVRRSTDELEYHQEIWAVPLDGGEPRRLTSGPTDTFPRPSPDGHSLAFLRKRAHAGSADGQTAHGTDGKPPTQIWVLPLDGGEAWQLTHEEHDVSGFAWSPDGTRIGFWGWRGPARFIVGKRDDGKEPTARRMAVGGWRVDEVGHVDYRTHLSVIDAVECATAVPLTDGDFDVANPAWDADGRSLVFSAARHELADLYPRPSIWRVSSTPDHGAPAEPVEVLRLRGVAEHAVPSRDGRWLAVAGVDEDGAPDNAEPGLFIAPADGSGPAVPLAADLDLPIGAWLDTDLNGWMSEPSSGVFWRDTESGPELLALVTRRGRSNPWAFPVDAATGAARGAPRLLAEGDAACWQMAVAATGRVVVVGTLGSRAMEVMEPDGTGAYRSVTTIGSAWQASLALPRMENRLIDGPGGAIETWIAHPGQRDAGQRPLVVDIHGGPLGGWAPTPSLEVQMLVGAGFVVALPNIRGSAAYGRDWITPHMGHWGEVDAADILAVIDALVADGTADAGHIGILGLSYGGFLVNWLVGAYPDRFAAAVSENGVSNQVAVWALSWNGPDYNRRAKIGEPFDETGVSALWRQSPLRLAARVCTPLLMLQGEADLVCPPGDNEQLFLVLRALERTVEYVLYPESSHVYAVTGRPDRRRDRHARMLEWFRRYLTPGS
jgi:dipeptidyl aminopeptidase/acylaminoacyl peptidase